MHGVPAGIVVNARVEIQRMAPKILLALRQVIQVLLSRRADHTIRDNAGLSSSAYGIPRPSFSEASWDGWKLCLKDFQTNSSMLN